MEKTTRTFGSRTVRRVPVLDWERLIDLYGDRDVLESRINNLKARLDTLKPWFETREIPLDEVESLLDLADKYLNGWRPDSD